MFVVAFQHYPRSGWGISQDYNRAFNLFKQSADKGWYDAYYWMGVCYKEGYGCTKNAALAIQYIDAAISALPNLIELYCLKGDIYYRNNELNKAYETYQIIKARFDLNSPIDMNESSRSFIQVMKEYEKRMK